MRYKLATYYHSTDLPVLYGGDTFHSVDLFRVYELTPGYTPLLIVASQLGEPVAWLLAVIRKTRKWLLAGIAKQCVVYGNGVYLSDKGRVGDAGMADKDFKEEVFGLLLGHLTWQAQRRCAFVEFRNLDNSLFGYRYFREIGYFPVNWLRVRNSLHSLTKVEQRFSASRVRQVRKSLKSGTVARKAVSYEEVESFTRMLKAVYSSRIRRHFPSIEFFRYLYKVLVPQGKANIFVVVYKDKIIGGAVCLYSGTNAYLWFSGGMRKTYALQYPGVVAVWKALDNALAQGFRHLEFMDVGLPFRKHGYRTFVLRFGGKQSSTRRWFHVTWKWLNAVLVKFYV